MFRKIKEIIYPVKIWLDKIYKYPAPVFEKMDYDKYWQEKRGKNIGNLSEWQKIRADFVLENISGDKFIFCDVGSGAGAILKYLSENKVLKRGIGIDKSNLALDVLRGFGFEGLNLDFDNSTSISNIPESDFYILFEILEHIYEPDLLLKTLYSKSKKGVFFSFPNSGFFIYRLRLLFGKFPMQWRRHPSEHIRFWTLKDLKWWLKALNFDNFEIRPYKGIPFLNKIWPAMFSAAFVVYVKKSNENLS